jgi:hypothetical protein
MARKNLAVQRAAWSSPKRYQASLFPSQLEINILLVKIDSLFLIIPSKSDLIDYDQ